MTKKINTHWIEALLNPVSGTADFCDWLHDKKSCLKVKDKETAQKRVIAPFIKVHFDAWAEHCKEKAKLALRYALTITDSEENSNKFDFKRIYDRRLIIFDPPDDIRLFFLWIFETLFPSEDYHLEDADQYEAYDDYKETKGIEFVKDPWPDIWEKLDGQNEEWLS